MPKNAEIFDFEGTLWHGDKPILEQLALDFFSEISLYRKVLLAGTGLELYMLKTYYGRVYPKEFEKRSLESFESIFLETEKPSMEFVLSRAKEYAGAIPRDIIEYIRSKDDDLYIITTGTPRQILDAILDECDISGCFKYIYANSFDVQDGYIIGFEQEGFFSGRDGKRNIAANIFSSGNYSSVSAVGDSYSDLGIRDAAENAGIKCSMSLIENGHNKLETLPAHVKDVRYIPSIEDYFSHSPTP